MLIGIYLFIPPIASFLRVITRQNQRFWLYVVLSLLLIYVFILPTIQQVLGWFEITMIGESTLGWFTGRGALGISFMLMGYCIRTEPVLAKGSTVVRWNLFIFATGVLWGVCAIDYIRTKQSFLVTSGFLPIALFGFALFWLLLTTERTLRDKPRLRQGFYTLSTFSFDIYMMHLLVSTGLEAVLPNAFNHGLIKLTVINPITVLAISFAVCLLLKRVPITRQYLLLIKK